jgi:carbon monoxide dehydrogenase subunit G
MQENLLSIKGKNYMIKVKNSITINAPIEEVFSFMNDPENSAKWQNGVDSIEYEDQEQTVGSQFTEVRKFLGREMKTTVEVTRLEENQVWAAKAISGPIPFQVTVTFEPVGDGTKLTTSIEAEPGGFFKLAGGAVAKQLEKSMKEDSATLKTLLESA